MRSLALMTPALAFVVMGCSASTGSVDGPSVVAETAALDRQLVTSTPSQENKRPCAPPVAIPNRDLNEGETERLWYGDRIELVICARRHQAVLKFYADRDARIAGGK